MYPGLQAQEYRPFRPGVITVQRACVSHGLRSHALMSRHAPDPSVTSPLPVSPAVHVHANDPTRFVHVARESHTPWSHSFRSVHVRPLPRNPVLHLQANDPMELVHFAFWSHGLTVHSLKSLHCTPLPVNPALQLHWYDPGVLLHVALA